MTEVFFASVRDNSRRGFSSRVVPFSSSADVRTFSGIVEEGLCDEILDVVHQSVDPPEEVVILRHHNNQEEEEFEKAATVLEGRGHRSVETKIIGVDHVKNEDRPFDVMKVVTQLFKEARARTWGVTLERAYVPGAAVSSEKAQSLHRTAARSGFDKGAFRLLLSEYGLISAKEVTIPIYDTIKKRVSSEVIAKLYNEKYEKRQSPDPHPA